MAGTRLNLDFEIDDKSDIEKVLSSDKDIPKNELRVLERTDYAKKLKSVSGSHVSCALVANPNRKFGAIPSYTIGFAKKLKIVFTNQQATPLVINSEELIDREKREFRNNRVYSTYSICIISPPISLFEFLGSRNILAPYATPDY